VTTLQLYAAAIARKRELEAALDEATTECRRLAQRLNNERIAAAEAAMKRRKQ
jgi:hypothetical protein